MSDDKKKFWSNNVGELSEGITPQLLNETRERLTKAFENNHVGMISESQLVHEFQKQYQRGQKEGYDRGYFQGKQDCQPEIERLRARVKELEFKIELCLKDNIPEKIEDFYDIDE